MLWSMGSQRVGHDLTTKQQQNVMGDTCIQNFGAVGHVEAEFGNVTFCTSMVFRLWDL